MAVTAETVPADNLPNESNTDELQLNVVNNYQLPSWRLAECEDKENVEKCCVGALFNLSEHYDAESIEDHLYIYPTSTPIHSAAETTTTTTTNSFSAGLSTQKDEWQACPQTVGTCSSNHCFYYTCTSQTPQTRSSSLPTRTAVTKHASKLKTTSDNKKCSCCAKARQLENDLMRLMLQTSPTPHPKDKDVSCERDQLRRTSSSRPLTLSLRNAARSIVVSDSPLHVAKRRVTRSSHQQARVDVGLASSAAEQEIRHNDKDDDVQSKSQTKRPLTAAASGSVLNELKSWRKLQEPLQRYLEFVRSNNFGNATDQATDPPRLQEDDIGGGTKDSLSDSAGGKTQQDEDRLLRRPRTDPVRILSHEQR